MTDDAKKIFDRYADSIKIKAKKDGVSVGGLIDKHVPKDPVAQVRQTNHEVNQWRSKTSRSRGSSVLIRLPWKQDKPNVSAKKE